MPPPPLIALSPAFLQLLQADKETAYSLRPCFATRLEVYSVSSRSSSGHGGWVSCALLVTQQGELYLFNADNGCIINILPLDCPEAEMDVRAGHVEIVLQDKPSPDSSMQCMYIRAHQPESPRDPREAAGETDSTRGRNRAGERSSGGEEDPRCRTYAPFSYVMRFHCRNAPVALQLIRIIMMFVNQENGALSVRNAGQLLGKELGQALIADPLASAAPERSRNSRRGEKGVNMASPLRRGFSSPRRCDLPRMRDVAEYEKKRLTSASERIEIPPSLDSTGPLHPVSIPAFDDKGFGINDAGGPLLPTRDSEPRTAEDRPTADGLLTSKTLPRGVESQTATSELLSAQFCERVTSRMSHFSLASSEDVLLAYGMPGFEAQCAVFLVQQNILELIEKCVNRLLAAFPDNTMLLQERLLAREAVRDEIRLHFGTKYREMCDMTRTRIGSISLDQLAIGRDRAMMQQVHDTALESLLAESEAKRQEMLEEEANVFFGPNHELKTAKTGLPLAPVSVEETTNWGKEVAQAASALQAVERDIEQVLAVLDDDDDDDDGDDDNDEYEGGVGKAKQQEVQEQSNDILLSPLGSRRDDKGRFASVGDEATYLLGQIRKQQESIAWLQRQKGDAKNEKAGENICEDDNALELMRSHYNAIVFEQQEQIDSLKRELQLVAASFGVNARWMEQQIHRRGVAEEVLTKPSRM